MSRASEGPRRAVEKPSRRREKKPRTPLQKVLQWVGEFFFYVVIMLVVLSLVRAFLIQPFLVPSGSMEHTIEVGDTIDVWKPGELHRGDMIVFRDDLGWLGPVTPASPTKKVLAFFGLIPPQDEQYLVKRLIGLPGDHVSCCDASGLMSVNGQELEETSYLYTDSLGQTVDPSDVVFDIVVPEGRVFVMGDHRDDSADSRAHMCSPQGAMTSSIAFPAIDSVQGKVFAITRPLSRLQTFSRPDLFSEIPDSSTAPPPLNAVGWTCPLTNISP